MAEQTQKPKEKEKKQRIEQKLEKKKHEEKKHEPEKEIQEEVIVRILGHDILGSKNIYTGLTKIKGVSWTLSNAACVSLNIPRWKKISELSKGEIKKIEDFLKAPNIPDFLKNRQKDIETWETRHYLGTELDIKRDFDIRRLKKIKSYKGIRHIAGQPVRGQRTRSHFRKRGRAVGVKRSAEAKKK